MILTLFKKNYQHDQTLYHYGAIPSNSNFSEHVSKSYSGSALNALCDILRENIVKPWRNNQQKLLFVFQHSELDQKHEELVEQLNQVELENFPWASSGKCSYPEPIENIEQFHQQLQVAIAAITLKIHQEISQVKQEYQQEQLREKEARQQIDVQHKDEKNGFFKLCKTDKNAIKKQIELSESLEVLPYHIKTDSLLIQGEENYYYNLYPYIIIEGPDEGSQNATYLQVNGLGNDDTLGFDKLDDIMEKFPKSNISSLVTPQTKGLTPVVSHIEDGQLIIEYCVKYFKTREELVKYLHQK